MRRRRRRPGLKCIRTQQGMEGGGGRDGWGHHQIRRFTAAAKHSPPMPGQGCWWKGVRGRPPDRLCSNAVYYTDCMQSPVSRPSLLHDLHCNISSPPSTFRRRYRARKISFPPPPLFPGGRGGRPSVSPPSAVRFSRRSRKLERFAQISLPPSPQFSVVTLANWIARSRGFWNGGMEENAAASAWLPPSRRRNNSLSFFVFCTCRTRPSFIFGKGEKDRSVAPLSLQEFIDWDRLFTLSS